VAAEVEGEHRGGGQHVADEDRPSRQLVHHPRRRDQDETEEEDLE